MAGDKSGHIAPQVLALGGCLLLLLGINIGKLITTSRIDETDGIKSVVPLGRELESGARTAILNGEPVQQFNSCFFRGFVDTANNGLMCLLYSV